MGLELWSQKCKELDLDLVRVQKKRDYIFQRNLRSRLLLRFYTSLIHRGRFMVRIDNQSRLIFFFTKRGNLELVASDTYYWNLGMQTFQDWILQRKPTLWNLTSMLGMQTFQDWILHRKPTLWLWLNNLTSMLGMQTFQDSVWLWLNNFTSIGEHDEHGKVYPESAGKDWACLPLDVLLFVSDKLGASKDISSMAQVCKRYECYRYTMKDRNNSPCIIFYRPKFSKMVLYHGYKGWSPPLKGGIPQGMKSFCVWPSLGLHACNLATRETRVWECYKKMWMLGVVSEEEDELKLIYVVGTTVQGSMEMVPFIVDWKDSHVPRGGGSYNCGWASGNLALCDHIVTVGSYSYMLLSPYRSENDTALLCYNREEDYWTASEFPPGDSVYWCDFLSVGFAVQRKLVKILGKLGVVTVSQSNGLVELKICIFEGIEGVLSKAKEIVMPHSTWVTFLEILQVATPDNVYTYTDESIVTLMTRQCNQDFLHILCKLTDGITDGLLIAIIMYSAVSDCWEAIPLFQGADYLNMDNSPYHSICVPADSPLAYEAELFKGAVSLAEESNARRFDSIVNTVYI